MCLSMRTFRRMFIWMLCRDRYKSQKASLRDGLVVLESERSDEMVEYVTRVSVWFYSEGASPAAVVKRLMGLGFTPVRGAYDFVYKHSGTHMTESDLSASILEIANALHKALSGFKVLYNLETHAADEEGDYVPLAALDAELEETRREIEQIEKESNQEED